ncbi:alpha/beta hydrolase [Dyadobacter sandarakinus]|uniref:Esterase n=1 Tax=Dyadobacter sandarakinus TaxID=2747268 RepID=A0ABX7I1E7_9BACT|nr:alpha/beta hydrolase-fold protein [Dyadobacter sandarakinus]QRQ99858.1 esterase [Dyadobacter sandarakinus]
MKKQLLTVLLLAAATLTASAQAMQGSVERIKLHGKSLEGNLEGDSPDRDVSIYLPPGYKKDTQRRFPVVYFLHGFTDNDAQWYGVVKHWINLPQVVDKVFASGQVQEMIIVTPNAYTKTGGSFYSSSVTTGNWEEFVARELVAYMDQHYRTLPNAASRGLAGHSMGGYGTIRIGEKHPEIFSSLYLLSPCCMAPGANRAATPEAVAKIEAVKSLADIEKADFFTKAAFASAAAWSPNPNKAPFYADFPIGTEQPSVQAKWSANATLTTIDQYITNLRQLKGIAFDAGDKDQPIASTIKTLDQILTDYKIPHTYEEYEGDHLNRVGERIEQKMLPFFSKNLTGEKR